MEGRALALADGASDASAAAEWQAELTVDGTSMLKLDDEMTSTPGGSGGDSVRRGRWSGAGAGVGVRASGRTAVAAPRGRADTDAVATVAWSLDGKGVSTCALPRRAEVTYSIWSVLHHPDLPGPCEPGQIGLLMGGGVCP
jgi:hypothetical protein